MCYKLSSLSLAFVVLATVAVQPGIAQINYDSYNYWEGYRSWDDWDYSHGGPFHTTDGASDFVPIEESICESRSDTFYGQTAAYSIYYVKTGPGAGQASLSTSATGYGGTLSFSHAELQFGIGLDQPTNLQNVLKSNGAGGLSFGNPIGSHPAGPPSSILVGLYGNSGCSNCYPSSVASIVWGPVGQLPGQSPTNSLPSGAKKNTKDKDIPDNELTNADEPTMVSGAFLTGVPVDGGYGYTQPIYFGNPPASSPAPLDRAALGYGFISQGLNIASIVLPGALPNGDNQFELLVGETYYPVNAGSVFDFTSLVPGGVESFALMGIDPAEGFDPTAAPPFPVGLQFAGGGQTQLYTLTYAPILPGDFNKDGAVDAADYVLWRKGTYTQADYDLWRANFGETLGSGAVVGANDPIPEPTCIVLAISSILGLTCVYFGRRWRSA